MAVVDDDDDNDDDDDVEELDEMEESSFFVGESEVTESSIFERFILYMKIL